MPPVEAIAKVAMVAEQEAAHLAEATHIGGWGERAERVADWLAGNAAAPTRTLAEVGKYEMSLPRVYLVEDTTQYGTRLHRDAAAVSLGPGDFTGLGRAFADLNFGENASVFSRDGMSRTAVKATYREGASSIVIKEPDQTRVELPIPKIDAGFNVRHGFKHPIALFQEDGERGQISLVNDVHGRGFLHVSSPMPPNLHVTVDGLDATSFLNRTATIPGHLAARLSERYRLAVGPETKIEISRQRDGLVDWRRTVSPDPRVPADADQLLEYLRGLLN